MYNVLFSLLLVLTMAEQIGVQSGARIGIHNHLNVSQGGILHEYSRYGAFRTCHRTGALALHVASDTERSGNNAGYLLTKEILINADYVGRWRIRFDHRSTILGQFIRSRVYVNNMVVSGEFETDNTGYVTENYNLDIDLQAGDRVQLYCRRAGAGNDYFTRNFRIFYDWHIAGFGDPSLAINQLTAALALLDNTLIDVTAVL